MSYNLYGQRIPELQRGLNIVRMNDGTTKKIYVKKPLSISIISHGAETFRAMAAL